MITGLPDEIPERVHTDWWVAGVAYAAARRLWKQELENSGSTGCSLSIREGYLAAAQSRLDSLADSFPFTEEQP